MQPRPGKQRRWGPALIVIALTIASAWVLYRMMPVWPLIVVWSDVNVTLTGGDNAPAETSRLLTAGGLAVMASLLSWATLRGTLKLRTSAIAVSGLVLLLAFYPRLRTTWLAWAYDSKPIAISTRVLSISDGRTPAPITLVVEIVSPEWGPSRPPPLPASEFSNPLRLCSFPLTADAVHQLAREAGLFELPHELELEGALAHDWMQVGCAVRNRATSSIGLRAGGRHSPRLRRAADQVLGRVGLGSVEELTTDRILACGVEAIEELPVPVAIDCPVQPLLDMRWLNLLVAGMQRSDEGDQLVEALAEADSATINRLARMLLEERGLGGSDPKLRHPRLVSEAQIPLDELRPVLASMQEPGQVVISGLIGPDGTPRVAALVERTAHDPLNQLVAREFCRALYRPARDGNRYVTADVRFVVEFKDP